MPLKDIQQYWLHYAVNRAGYASYPQDISIGTNHTNRLRTTGRIRTPSARLAVTEKDGYGADRNAWPAMDVVQRSYIVTGDGIYHHGGGTTMNALYADGHCQAGLKKSAIPEGPWGDGNDFWGKYHEFD